jgi:hypothetical protein
MNQPALGRFDEHGERARPGRSEPRPRGSQKRMKLTERLVTPHAFSFGARRTERQPGRLPSPKNNCFVHLFHLSLLLSALFAIAAMQPPSQPIIVPPEQAAKEGLALVNEMFSQQPDPSTTTGVMAIRTSTNYTEIPIKFQTLVTPTNWVSVYEAHFKNRVETYDITHDGTKPNTYFAAGNAFISGTPITAPTPGPVRNIWAPFAGSDFSIADLGLEFLHWPDQKLLQKEMKRSRSCRVLESTNPNPRAGGYAKVKSWVDNESHGILLAQAFDAKGNKLKEFAPGDFSKSKATGQWQLGKMQITNFKTDSTTTVRFDVDK